MPLYMDIHSLGSVSKEDVEKAHEADLQTQDKLGVQYLKYWVNEDSGKIFCLVDALRRPPRRCTVRRTAWSPTTTSRCQRARSRKPWAADERRAAPSG